MTDAEVYRVRSRRSRTGDREGNYYAVLDVPFEATAEEIKKRYYSTVRTLHPDRRRPGGCSSEVLEQFHKVQGAWRCLSDPTRRLLYDLRNFGRSSIGKEAGFDGELHIDAEERLTGLQKEQAARDVRNMEQLHERTLRREQASRGVVVRTALYGDLRLRAESYEECVLGTRTIKAGDLVGPYIDVTMPVQSLVEQNTIVLPGGAFASKSDLPGFYDPTPLAFHRELSLYVLYEFRGHVHETIVGDRETLSLPYRRHVVPPGKNPRGPFSPANLGRLLDGSAGQHATSAPLSAGVGGRMAKLGSPAALEEAVVAYRLHSLRTKDPGEPTPRECFAALLVVGASMWYAWCLATYGKRRP